MTTAPTNPTTGSPGLWTYRATTEPPPPGARPGGPMDPPGYWLFEPVDQWGRTRADRAAQRRRQWVIAICLTVPLLIWAIVLVAGAMGD